MRILYKLLRPQEWNNFLEEGRFSGSVDDLRDGFIHFSYADQVDETARKHFAGVKNLILLAVSPAGFQEQLKDEISRGGRCFPHLYAPIFLTNILWKREIAFDSANIPVIGALEDHLLPSTTLSCPSAAD